MSDWTDDCLVELKEWQRLLQSKCQEHRLYANKLASYEIGVAFSGIVLGAVATTLQIFTTTGTTHEHKIHSVTITSTIFTSVATLCSVTQKYFQFQVKSERHWASSNQFANLSMDISAQLLLAPDLRTPIQEFVKDLVTRRALILQSEPQLP